MKPSMKKQALKHYDTMIKIVSSWEDEIKTLPPRWHHAVDWYGDKCPYCKKYNRAFTREPFETDCGECPLTKKPKSEKNCCNRLWVKMNTSKTWNEWLKYAKKIKEYIEVNG